VSDENIILHPARREKEEVAVIDETDWAAVTIGKNGSSDEWEEHSSSKVCMTLA